jgi:NAD+ synthase (glutamine-hydrolysing)
MATKHSGEETRSRAKKLSEEIGATFVAVNIDPAVSGFEEVFKNAFHRMPKFKVII